MECFTYSYKIYNGFEFQPKYRYYVYGEANNYGFYVQAKVNAGYYSLSENDVAKRLSSKRNPKIHFMSQDRSLIEIAFLQYAGDSEYVPVAEDMSLEEYTSRGDFMGMGLWSNYIALPIESGISFSVRF